MEERCTIGKDVKFERIRRITGYLVGTMDKWNDAKKAEERDRVKHGLGQQKTKDCGNRRGQYCRWTRNPHDIVRTGMPHHCQGCHNPETWEFDGGTWWTTDDLVKVIEENPLAKGVTFSGGEPFSQAEAFAELAGKLKNRGYEVASYSGFTMEELLRGSREQRMLLEKLDVLIDGPYIEEQRSLSLAYRGSRNQRIIDVPASLRTGEIKEIVSGRWQGEYQENTSCREKK